MTGSHDRTIKLWDLQKGTGLRSIFGYSAVNDLALLDDTAYHFHCLFGLGLLIHFNRATLASGHMDSRIRIWDVRTSSCQHELADVHMAQVNSLARSTGSTFWFCFSLSYAPLDGTTLLTSARDHSLKLIDLRTYRTLVTLTAEGYRAASSRAILSPDGAYVLAGSQDGSIFAWSAATGKVEAQLKGHQYAPCFGVRLFDGMLICLVGPCSLDSPGIRRQGISTVPTRPRMSSSGRPKLSFITTMHSHDVAAVSRISHCLLLFVGRETFAKNKYGEHGVPTTLARHIKV